MSDSHGKSDADLMREAADGKGVDPNAGKPAGDESPDKPDDAPRNGSGRRKALKERVTEKAARIAGLRFEQAMEMAEDLRHKRGCPEEGRLPGDEDGRVEHYSATRPRTNERPAEELLVVRCMECGEEEVAPDESEKR